MADRRLSFRLRIESQPDGQGRQSFTLEWEDPDGVFRPEVSKQDGNPVGHRRGQCFFAVVEKHTTDLRSRGHTVEIVK